MPRTAVAAKALPSINATLLAEIETFLTENGYSATRFGKEAAGDVNLVHDLRKGLRARADRKRPGGAARDLKGTTIDKIRAFMAKPGNRSI